MKYGKEVSSFEMLPRESAVLIYGAGGAGLRLLERLTSVRPDLNVLCFVDSEKNGGSVAGKPLRNVADLGPEELNATILVASIYYRQIALELQRRNIQRYYIFFEYGNAGKTKELRLPLAELHLDARLEVVDEPPLDALDETWLTVFNLPVGKTPDEYSDLAPGGVALSGCGLALSCLDDRGFESVRRELERRGYRHVLILDIEGDSDHLRGLIGFIRARADVGRVVLHRGPGRVKSVIVAESVRLLYFPIPKCGSTSIGFMLRSQLEKGFAFNTSPHRGRSGGALLCYADVSDPRYEGFVSFAVVRSPYARLASLYNSRMKRGPESYVFPSVRARFGGCTFADFCRYVASCPDAVSEHHFKSQSSFLSMPGGGLCTNRLVHLENLSSEIGPLFAEAGIASKMQHRNRSNRKAGDYLARYYDRQLIDLVNERYEQDFVQLGYPFR
ncbi:sulfotransferase family 2 domain-containing protein [Paucidesulfovibrio longus]|uniref:sulfotransferase family 2 domain-containing protein n=1 Tax=Paucidesulfovibrio longus TaxID=889 RepID=UPI0012DDC25E|nr:sulfotransferase family 2 domain-containing protein [Paucidesulfovibrio longus]